MVMESFRSGLIAWLKRKDDIDAATRAAATMLDDDNIYDHPILIVGVENSSISFLLVCGQLLSSVGCG